MSDALENGYRSLLKLPVISELLIFPFLKFMKPFIEIYPSNVDSINEFSTRLSGHALLAMIKGKHHLAQGSRVHVAVSD